LLFIRHRTHLHVLLKTITNQKFLRGLDKFVGELVDYTAENDRPAGACASLAA